MKGSYICSTLVLALFVIICIVSGAPEYAVSVVGAITVHELGHLLLARLLSVRLLKVSYTPIGIRMLYNFSGVGILGEILVYLGGPVIGFISASALMLTGKALNGAVKEFILSSYTLSAINLMPIKGFDGGNVIESILSVTFLPDKAFLYEKNISRVAVLLFWILTIYVEMKIDANISMLTLAVYLLYTSF